MTRGGDITNVNSLFPSMSILFSLFLDLEADRSKGAQSVYFSCCHQMTRSPTTTEVWVWVQNWE